MEVWAGPCWNPVLTRRLTYHFRIDKRAIRKARFRGSSCRQTRQRRCASLNFGRQTEKMTTQPTQSIGSFDRPREMDRG